MGLFEASVAGIAPALVAFYVTFDSYDRVVSDRGLFIALFVGMVLGWIFALPELAGVFFLDPFILGPETNPDLLLRAGVSVATIAFFQEGIRGLTLNLPAIRGKWQSPFWGIALGLGSGAVFSVVILALGRTGGLALPEVALNVPFVVAFVLAQGAFGGLIGLGVTEHRAVRGFFIASVAHMGFNALILAERLSGPLLGSPEASQVAHWSLIVAMLAYALYLYRHMLLQLPKMLPKDKQSQRRQLLRGTDS